MVNNVLRLSVLLVTLLVSPQPLIAAAAGEVDDDGGGDACATDLLHCYEAAAKVENFWYRWAAGIDCELNFTKCVRIAIVGH